MKLNFVLIGALLLGVAPAHVIAAETTASTTPPAAAADISIGGEVVMRLRSTAGGLSTAKRAASITDRLTRLVAVPDLTPADVVLYTPAGKAPVIYVLGRKLITVDKATAAAAGGKPVDVATKWAKRLQQVLPRVDIRLPNEPEPVVPENPPLTITSDFDQVGGDVGDVMLRDKLVMRIRGAQPHGETAAERADELSAHIAHVVHALPTLTADDIQVKRLPMPKPAVATKKKELKSKSTTEATTPESKDAPKDGKTEPAPIGAAPAVVAPPPIPASGPPAALMIGTHNIFTVDDDQATAAGAKSPEALVQSWVKNIRKVLFPAPKPAPVPSVPLTTPPTIEPPTPPAAPEPPSTPTPVEPPTPPAAPATPETGPATPEPPSTPAQPSTTPTSPDPTN